MAWTNEEPGRVDGPVVQVDAVGRDFHLNLVPPVRSAYLSQVQALVPDRIDGRSDELAVLAAFCTSEATAGEFLWWRAEAWSGKSALLSWFVLHPPADVRVVSFFVTSRLPGQNDRRGFVDNVLDQLHDLAGRPPRTDLTDANREPYLLQLLAEVANRVREQGEHFVLVVDGLDEDRGLDGSADAHSIAALLPRRGVRVVVAGRPDPVLPDDVPAGHPLRTTARVEQLSPSPEAIAVRDVMTRDLKRLLHGNEVQQDLLGFVTAAGGGLSTQDLAELTGASPWQVEEYLRTTGGRSFALRPGEPPVHLLAHEQLHVLATEMFGPRLRSYQERLDGWAITYRARGWPPDTPRYLLHGHAAVLAAAGDRHRLLDHVTDPRRHEVAYMASGNHHAAVGEIETAQAVFLGDDEPDLVALARLAVHRIGLQESGNWIPASLPETWALCGRDEHAQALIPLISEPIKRIRALVGTAEKLHRTGHPDQAARMLDLAQTLTSVFNQDWGDWLHRELANVTARIGDHDRTRRVIDDLQSVRGKAHLYASVALTASMSATGREQAERWYASAEAAFASRPPRTRFSSKVDTAERAIVFATMAAAAAVLGHQERAAELAAAAIDPESTYKLWSRTDVAAVVKVLTRGGFRDAALSVAEACTTVDDREDALLCIVQTIANDGDLEEAEALARTAEDARHRCARLAAVAVAAGRRAEPDRADRLRAEVVAALDGLPADEFRRYTVMATAVADADAGRRDQAEDTVFNHLLPNEDFQGALSVAVAFLRRGEPDRAERLVEASEQAARSALPRANERTLLHWIDVMTDFGDVDRADPVVRSIQDPEIRDAAWHRLAEAIAVTGDLPRLTAALDQIARPSLQRRPRMEMIRVLLARDEKAEAIALARTAGVTTQRAAALDFIAGTTRDRGLLHEVIGLATDSTDLGEQATILCLALRTTADMGDRATADLLLRRLRTIQAELSAEAQRTGVRADTFYLPSRVRTLTELAERIERFYNPDLRDKDASVVSTSGAPPLFTRPSSHLPLRTRLARALTIGNWIDVVDRIVNDDPDVYTAIVGELDRLHS